jgi:hypothetical protein
MVAMVGDVVIAPVVVAIVERLESLVGLPYRVGSRSPSVASPADDTRFVCAFGDVSHDGSVKSVGDGSFDSHPYDLLPPPPVSSWDAPDFQYNASGSLPVHECQYLSGEGFEPSSPCISKGVPLSLSIFIFDYANRTKDETLESLLQFTRAQAPLRRDALIDSIARNRTKKPL